MAKKYIPSPSDFAKPTPGKKLKKGEVNNVVPSKAKKQRKSKRAFLAEEEKLKPGYVPVETVKKVFVKKEKSSTKLTNKNYKPGEHPIFEGNDLSNVNPKQKSKNQPPISNEIMPLNKYISHCGICSRRDAVEIIKEGKVKVNEKVIKEPGFKVTESDNIVFEAKRIFIQKKLVYYLLNKPKDYITTTDDPEGRKTVMDLLGAAPEQRIFPIGRLDRNTTGLLLLTNDGDLTQKLSHPKNNVKKIYQVVLDKPLTKGDFDKIAEGIVLEDGLAPVDELAYTDLKDKREIGIEIHIGRNRIVRRIFESLGYQVKALDRVYYAGLTKKNVQRGKWRELTEKEILFLKHFK
jgi:23S rRNA pseudouridine2605 synthase